MALDSRLRGNERRECQLASHRTGKFCNPRNAQPVMRTVSIKAPRGPLKLDDYDNPIQNVYVGRVQKVKHPVLGDVLMNVPVKTYTAVSQFWTWKPEEFLARGPYKR